MSKVLTRTARSKMLENLMAYLGKHVLPEQNEVEIEVSQPLVNDLKKEGLDPLGMAHFMPGPDIYIKIHIALNHYNPKPKHSRSAREEEK